MSELITCAEAADILNMTESGSYKLISRGVLTRRHNGRRDRGRTGIVPRPRFDAATSANASRKGDNQ